MVRFCKGGKDEFPALGELALWQGREGPPREVLKREGQSQSTSCPEMKWTQLEEDHSLCVRSQQSTYFTGEPVFSGLPRLMLSVRCVNTNTYISGPLGPCLHTYRTLQSSPSLPWGCPQEPHAQPPRRALEPCDLRLPHHWVRHLPGPVRCCFGVQHESVKIALLPQMSQDASPAEPLSLTDPVSGSA